MTDRAMTAGGRGEATLEVKGSRFIAVVVPATTPEAVRRARQEVRSTHPRATHHVPAWRLLDADGHAVEGARDDGEPAGTAGRPMLRILRGAGLVNTCAVVVRYYGGVKLGAGGLARAYGGALRAALEVTQQIPWVAHARVKVFAPFAAASALETQAAEALAIEAREFTGEGVWLTVSGEAARVRALAEQFRVIDPSDVPAPPGDDDPPAGVS